MSKIFPAGVSGQFAWPGIAAGLAAFALIAAATPLAEQDPRALLDEAVSEFAAGRVEASLERFDQLVDVDPDGMPYLWHRGIALYYAERWDDCRAQFEAHRVVNPSDVENAAWHFLCVARQESPARARELLLPGGTRSSRPHGRDLPALSGGVLARGGDGVGSRPS
jgi:lipoprotein NlpI